MIATSYFSNLRNIKNPLSISARAPDWYRGPQFKPLAPKFWFFDQYKRGIIDAEGYTRAYYEHVLRPRNAKDVLRNIIELAGPNATLLCYEKPGDFCHRRLVANWLEAELKISVPELPRP